MHSKRFYDILSGLFEPIVKFLADLQSEIKFVRFLLLFIDDNRSNSMVALFMHAPMHTQVWA